MAQPIPEQLKNLPGNPGVYLFKTRQGNVLYVGKAKVLKNRVRSYFRPSADLGERKSLMIPQITTIDWIETDTEDSALVLEDRLIKDYQPRFNILAKDDKGFLYIHITNEKFPRVQAVRRPDLRKAGIFYGPYPFAKRLRDILKLLHTIFPYRTCNSLPKQACLEYYINRCSAPCIEKIDESDYRVLIDKVIDFFERKNTDIIIELENQMADAAEEQQFERAARIRDQIAAVKKLKSYQKTPKEYLREYYKHKAIDPQAGLQELADGLQLQEIPHRIEVYDISHHQGMYAVGSMVVFIDGIPDKSEYRRFRIKTVEQGKPDDFKSMREVVRRRVKRDWPLPDLAIMDGGKGQLSSVLDLWEDKKVPVVSLAKRHEELFMPNNSVPLTLPPGSQGLFLVQRMRDEAHRFAITYYRKLHTKQMRETKRKKP